jgi:phosphoglycolate phosphatase-like HAD superfamily hydrolase
MTVSKNLALFDIDGVVLDSLEAHLNFCKNYALEKGFTYKIPTESEFKDEITGTGKKISPMYYFFTAIGFSDAESVEASNEYDKTFSKKHKPGLFKNIEMALSDLDRAGIALGFVTSNTLENVRASLGDSIKIFDQRLMFAYDGRDDFSKSACIKEAASIQKMHPSQCFYIGDQEADFLEAHKAEAVFIGVAYGWGISSKSHGYPVVSSPIELRDYLLKACSEKGNQDLTIAALEHARETLVFFADLRSKNFNFFLVLIGTLAAGYAQFPALSLPASIAGALSGLLFLGLDWRTSQMIQDARAELMIIEPVFNIKMHTNDRWKDKTRNHTGSGRTRFFSHTWIYRTLMIVTTIVSIIGFYNQYNKYVSRNEKKPAKADSQLAKPDSTNLDTTRIFNSVGQKSKDSSMGTSN